MIIGSKEDVVLFRNRHATPERSGLSLNSPSNLAPRAMTLQSFPAALSFLRIFKILIEKWSAASELPRGLAITMRNYYKHPAYLLIDRPTGKTDMISVMQSLRSWDRQTKAINGE